MIERAWVATCDECYTEDHTRVTHREYVQLLRDQGWQVGRKTVLCPDCVADRAVAQVTRS